MNNPAVELSIPENQLSMVFPLLRQGVDVVARPGQTVHAFLHQDLGLSEQVIQSRVQTVFLNGQPADELNTARLAQGDVLTLSAAMPGLLGACMRVDSPYAAMRDSRSQDRDEQQWSQGKGETMRFTLKLFNFMASEIGPCVLTRGVYLRQEQLQKLMEQAADHDLLIDRVRLKVDGEVLDLEQESMAALLGSSDTVFVRCLSNG